MPIIASSLPDPRMHEPPSSTCGWSLSIATRSKMTSRAEIPSRPLPVFFLLDSDLRVNDAINGGEWDEDIRRNIAPVIDRSCAALRQAPLALEEASAPGRDGSLALAVTPTPRHFRRRRGRHRTSCQAGFGQAVVRRSTKLSARGGGGGGGGGGGEGGGG